MASKMVIIHPQAFLQPERAINVTPDKKAATASVLVTLHNDMRLVDRRDGFSLLHHDAPTMRVEDAAFHKFSEMSNIGPWLDKQDKLQWEHKMDAGYRGARNVRNGRVGGAANRDALIEKEGYMINDRGQEVIAGFHELGKLGGAANRDALIEKEGYMINDGGKEVITGFHKLGMLTKDALIEKEGFMINDGGMEVITGFHKLGKLGGAAIRDALIEKEGFMINDRGQECITGFHKLGNERKAQFIAEGAYTIDKHGKQVLAGFQDIGSLGNAAKGRGYAATAMGEHHTHICISALCQRGASVTWTKGTNKGPKKDYRVYVHLCYDFAHSGAAGQIPKQIRGMQNHMCKKCHRLAGHCAGGDGCRVSCNTPRHKSCQHLH